MSASASASKCAAPIVGLVLGSLAASPTHVIAQSVGWTAAATVLVDRSHSLETHVGPGVTGEVELRGERELSFAGVVAVARTDFEVGPDNLHRNHGMAAVAARWMRESTGPSLGFLFGVGAIFWDDVSETDSAFRSGANGAGVLLTGLELRLPMSERFGASISVRDAITGLVNGIADPSERDIEHRFLLSAGIYRR